ncbi:MAG: helix-turn-helix transcriptional regulator [Anditalea sp.]
METLSEVLDIQHHNLIKYDEMLSGNKGSLEEIGELTPHIFHCNDADYNFQFVNEKGCCWFCLSKEKILNMGERFFKKFYHPDTIEFEFPKIKRFYKSNDCNTVYSNYQQIFNPSIQAYAVCLVFIKKCSCFPGFVSITQPIEKDLSISKKMNRIISEELFKKNHIKDFEYLTLRETEILKLLAEGLNNPQISDQLYISRRTVEQHRKNINRKLHVHSYKDIMAYAYAFDLV